MFYRAGEHTKHNAAGYTTLAPCEHTNGHNKVAGYIHRTIWKHMGLQVTDMYYENVPEWIINVKGTTIMWYVPVITD